MVRPRSVSGCQGIGLKQPYHRPRRQSATCGGNQVKPFSTFSTSIAQLEGARQPIFVRSTPVCMACRVGNLELDVQLFRHLHAIRARATATLELLQTLTWIKQGCVDRISMLPMKWGTSVGRLRVRGVVLLFLWLLAWGTAAAQPCCEALASVIPHHSDATVLDEHGHSHHHDSTPAKQGHDHCPQAKAVDFATETPALGTSSQRASPLPYLRLESSALRLPFAVQISRAPSRYATPPPLSRSPFLSKRLLI